MSQPPSVASNPPPIPEVPLVSGGLLMLVSIAGLFLELMLIRWIGSELPLFGFLRNAVLVTCFLGMGMGCWRCREPFALRDILWPLAILVLVLTVLPGWLGLGTRSGILWVMTWGTAQDLAGINWTALAPLAAIELILAVVILTMIWDLSVAVGRLLGRLLDDQLRPEAMVGEESDLKPAEAILS